MLPEQTEQQAKDLMMELCSYALCFLSDGLIERALWFQAWTVCFLCHLHLHFLIICRLGWWFSVISNGGSVIPTLLFCKVGPAVSMTGITLFVWLHF